MKDNILTEMERYVKENGPEALEKILASKVNTQIQFKKYLNILISIIRVHLGVFMACYITLY